MSEGYMICVKCGLAHSQMFIYTPEWKDFEKMKDEGQEVTGDRAGRAVSEKDMEQTKDQKRVADLMDEVAKTARLLNLPRADVATIENWMTIYVKKTPVTRNKEYVAVAAIVLSSWFGHAPLWHSNIAYRLGLKDQRLRIVMRTFSLLLKPNMRFLDHNDHLDVAIRAYFTLFPCISDEQEVSRLIARYEKKYGNIELHKCMHYVMAAHYELTTSLCVRDRARELGIGLTFMSLCRRFAPLM